MLYVSMLKNYLIFNLPNISASVAHFHEIQSIMKQISLEINKRYWTNFAQMMALDGKLGGTPKSAGFILEGP